MKDKRGDERGDMTMKDERGDMDKKMKDEREDNER